MTKTTLAAKAILLMAALPTVTAVGHTAYKKLQDQVNPGIVQTRQVNHEHLDNLNKALSRLAGVKVEEEKPTSKTVLFPHDPDSRRPDRYYKDLGKGQPNLTRYYRDAQPTGQKGETQ
jgi:hypothetical protein